MGARWLWYARCPKGHVYWNFSGGAEDCYTCDEKGEVISPVRVIDCPHWATESTCNCSEEILKEAPVRYSYGIPVFIYKEVEYIKISDIPSETAQKNFLKWLSGQTTPIIDNEKECAFPWDWERFVEHRPIVD